MSAFAEELGETKHVNLLNETLEEEKATDEKLSIVAGHINAQANQGKEADEDDMTTAKKKSRTQLAV